LTGAVTASKYKILPGSPAEKRKQRRSLISRLDDAWFFLYYGYSGLRAFSFYQYQ